LNQATCCRTDDGGQTALLIPKPSCAAAAAAFCPAAIEHRQLTFTGVLRW